MTSPAGPLVRARGVVKAYQALRPLRVEALTIARGDVAALMGLDAQAAEMLVGLLTGAVLPDSGEIRLFDRSTSEVRDSEAWLALLDKVGILTDRAVLIGQFTVAQNLAMPFTLAVDPLTAEVRGRAAALADEVGLDPRSLDTRVGDADPAVQARVRLGRALALDPVLLVAEHPTATLPREAVKPFAADLARIARARQLAVLAITADGLFGRALGGDVLTHEAATGVLRRARSWTKLFGRG